MTSRPPIAVLGSLAAIAAIALPTSGCGSTSATLDPVARAAETTTRAGGAHVSLEGSVSSPATGMALTLKGQGAINFSRHEGNLVLVMSGLPASVQSQLNESSLQMNELFKSGSLYVGSSLFAAKLPGGAHWLRLDLTRIGQAIGLDPSSLASGNADPTATLKYLSAGGATASVLGHESVRGVATTHYAGTLNLLKAAEAAPGANRAELRAAFRKLVAETGTDSVPVEAWVDGHGLVRRTSMRITVNANGQKVQAQLSVEYHDFGPTPSVNAPAASEVFDVTPEALGRLRSNG